MDYRLPGSSVHEILQVRILEWVAMPFSRAPSWPRDWTCISYVSCVCRWLLSHCATWETLLTGRAAAKIALVRQSSSMLGPCTASISATKATPFISPLGWPRTEADWHLPDESYCLSACLSLLCRGCSPVGIDIVIPPRGPSACLFPKPLCR